MNLPRNERFVSPFLPIYAALGLAIGILAGEKLVASGIFVCSGEQLQPNTLWLLLPLPFLLTPGLVGEETPTGADPGSDLDPGSGGSMALHDPALRALFRPQRSRHLQQ